MNTELRLPLLLCLVAPVFFQSTALAGDPAVRAPAHAVPGKGTLGVGIRYTLTTPLVGQPSSLVVTTTSSNASSAAATITFRPGEGVTLASDDVAIGEARALSATSRFVFTVTPISEGVHYVNVFLHAGSRSRAMAIPVAVGEPTASLNKANRVQAPQNGERVIAVPAR